MSTKPEQGFCLDSMGRSKAAPSSAEASAPAPNAPVPAQSESFGGVLALANVDAESQHSGGGSNVAGYNVTSVALTPEYLLLMELPSDYVEKICSLCGNSSASETPFPDHSDVKAWGKCLPWGAGTRARPRRDVCRICHYIFCHGGFNVIYPKLRAYSKLIKNTPELHLEFMDSRAKYVTMKSENPRMILKGGSQELFPDRIVSMIKQRSSSLHKPKQFFMELEVFKQKHGQPDPSQVVKKVFNGKTMEGVMITRKEDQGLWEVAESETQQVEVRQATSDMELRGGQAQQTFAALTAQMDAQASASEGKEVVVVNCVSGSGDGSCLTA